MSNNNGTDWDGIVFTLCVTAIVITCIIVGALGHPVFS